MRISRASRRRGFSLIEMVIAMGLLVTLTLAFAVVFVQQSRLAANSRGNALLAAATRNIVARLKAEKFESLTQEFGPSSDQAAFHCGQEGTISFGVGGESILSGSLEFFDVETAIPASFAGLSSFDLNSNGTLESQPVLDYKILPVRNKLELNDGAGARTAGLDILLNKK